MPDLAAHATRLRSLHVPGSPLVLPNAWDAHSARMVVTAGFPVVATSSSAVATVAGSADGEQMAADAMFDAVRAIADAVDVPVTADIESGYGLSADDLAEKLIAAGAVGCNLEDTDHRGEAALVDAAAQADRIAAVVEAGLARGVELVVNARVDVHLRAFGAEETRLDEMVARANRYLEAGAACAYPIGVSDPAVIATLVADIDGPVNILLRPGTPSLDELSRLGVARASLGGGIFGIATAAVASALTALASGSSDLLWA